MNAFSLPRLLLGLASVPCLGPAAAAGEQPALPPPAATDLFCQAQPPSPVNAIDQAVFARLADLGIEPARRCTDAVFVRRAFLDVIGTLPTAAEAQAFLRDDRPDKRAELVDRLLRRDEFADYWTMKWCDLLRVKAEFPINLWPNAAQAYHRWIYTAVRDNLPYDQFARTLLTANGSNVRVGPANFARATQGRQPEALARAAALTFMGARAEAWPADRLAGLTGFFARVSYKATGEWKEEIVYFDPDKPLPDASGGITFPDGTRTRLAADVDPRVVFADWLIAPDNPWFARAIVNRVWSWFFGRGIIHEPDDIRPDNPPANPELLAVLERRLIADGYDLRALFRFILTSATYQLSPVARSSHPEAEANFAFYPIRRLEAEVLIDALNQLTGATERYSSAIPEPFTYLPEDHRAIALPDGSISSPFLEMFGRPGRDTGTEAERNNQITATQRLHLLNSSHLRRKLEQGPRMQALLRRSGPREIVDALYLAFLSRAPTSAERAALVAHSRAPASTPRDAAQDLAWALVNSAEFLYRH